jgi:hypothetical protein
MPRKKPALILERPVKKGLKEIKLRIDARTVITVGSQKAVEAWRKRHPKLEVLP